MMKRKLHSRYPKLVATFTVLTALMLTSGAFSTKASAAIASSMSGSAYGISASGAVNIPAQPSVTLPSAGGNKSDSLASISKGGIKTGLIKVSTTGSLNDGTSQSTFEVNNLVVGNIFGISDLNVDILTADGIGGGSTSACSLAMPKGGTPGPGSSIGGGYATLEILGKSDVVGLDNNVDVSHTTPSGASIHVTGNIFEGTGQGNDTSSSITSNILHVTITATDGDTHSTEEIIVGHVESSITCPVDTVKPTGSVSINAGAAYAKSTSVTLKLGATDSGSGVDLMRLRNSNTTTWSASRAYSTSVAWTLPSGNGSKTVYVQYRDKAGNWSPVYSDSIYLDTALPVTGLPVQSVAANTQLGTSTVPVKVAWSGSDTGSGIAKYQLQQRSEVSGGWQAWSWVTSGTTSRSLNRQLAPGRYQFRIRAEDRATNWSSWRSGATFTVAPYQETSTATNGKVAYSGTWARQYLGSAYGRYTRYTATKGRYATFTFTGGKQVAWVSSRYDNRGYAWVYLDGRKIETVRLYSASWQPREVVFTRTGLDPSVKHTLKVYVPGTKPSVSKGTRVDVDAFVVVR